MPMICTSVNPAGAGAVGAFLDVSGAADCELFVVVAAAFAGAVCTVVEVDTLSMTGVDDAPAGVEEAIVSTGDVVEAAAESVDVAATCAKAGLTMASPAASAKKIALAPTNVMMLAFIS